MNKIVDKGLTLIPFLLFNSILANIFYISFISIFSNTDFSNSFYPLILFFFLISFLIFKRYFYLFKTKTEKKFIFIFFPYLLIIFLRLPIYTKVHDDLTYYLIAGEYTKNLWTNQHVFPTYAIYLYNALPLFYNSLISLFGLRITLFISMFSLSFWMVSLNFRLTKLLKNNFQKILLDFFFISFPFWPHLMAIHGAFMADFFSLVFILEAFYQFINRDKDKTFALIFFIVAGLVKQSSIFFVLPIFIYLIFINIKKINWFFSIGLILFFSSYFIRLYQEVGNPILGGLFNNIFKSPIAPLENVKDSRFGGETLVQKLLWPFIAQFSPRFAEGFVSKYAKVYFTLFLALPYFFSLFYFFAKKKIEFIVIFLSFIFWSFYIGYARWVIPLIGASWIYLIKDLDFKFLPKVNFKFISTKELLFYFLIIFLSLSSIKTDFGWRPYHNLTFFKQLYLEGTKLIGKDRYKDIEKEFINEFKNFDVVSPIRSEKAYFYSYFANYQNKTIIQSMPDEYYKNILNSEKISNRFKSNIKKFFQAKKILLVVDTMSAPEEVVKESAFFKKFNCQKIGNFHDIKTIQSSLFSTIAKYDCFK